MNEHDEQLQEHLVRLEIGEPFSSVVVGLPEDMAADLALAAELKKVNLPVPGETAVVSHRAAAMRAAQQQAVAARAADYLDEPQPVAFAAFAAWWRNHRARAVVAIAFAAVVLVIFGFASGWLAQSKDNDPVVVERDEDPPAQEGDTALGAWLDRLFDRDNEAVDAPSGEAPSVVGEELETEDASTAGVTEDDLAYETFLPNLVLSLQTSPQTAVLGEVQGLVSVQKADGNWVQVSSLSSVAAGSRVRTSALSKASLTFYDGSVATLGPDSEISIDALNALPPAEGFRTVILTQWQGTSTHNVAFRNDGGSQYEVKSPSGTGIARGTIFEVIVLPNLTSRYTVLEGRVDVTSISVTVSVMAGQLSTILPNEPPAEPVFQVSGEGEVTQIGEQWTIGGQTFATDAQTVIVGNPQVGDWVKVQGRLLEDGSKVADQIVLVRHVPRDGFTLTAVVTAIGVEQWLLGNTVILLDEETAVDDDIELGDRVRVTGVVLADGSLLARRIQKQLQEGHPFAFTGIVQAIGTESWLISGIVVTVNGRTEIDDALEVSDVVTVEGHITLEGSWLAREIKAVDEDDEAEAATFEFTGLVESMNPWVVAGIALATDEWTEIDTAVEPGSRVNVEGIILADGTWLATAINLLRGDGDGDGEDDNEIVLRFTGIVESTEPWVVSGITLWVTSDSHIADGVVAGSLVQVVARLAGDGRWEIVWIRPLLPPTTGCFTIHTRITGVNGRQLVLTNWPALTLQDGVAVEGNLAPNSTIALNICLGDEGTVIIVNIIVIQVMINTTPGSGNGGGHDNNGGEGGGNSRITICHNNRNTLTVSESALNGHLSHGDTLGPCSKGGGDDDDDDD